MKRLLIALALLFVADTAYAQQPQLVSPCVRTSSTACPAVSATNPFPITGTITVTFPTIGAAVPATGIYNGINVAGTLRGWTGSNPTGTVYAGQVDLAAVAGATTLTGNGTAAGSLRVALPTDGTGVVGLIAGTAGIGNVGGKTTQVCVTPTVTATNAYGTNYVVGGLLTFANVWTGTGTGILQGVSVTIKKVETSGFTFVPFNSNPSATTWTDAAVANINATDVPAVRASIALSAYSGLGTHTIAAAAGIGQASAPAATTLYGVLIANAALTNQFGSASDVQVCVQALNDL